MASCELGAGGGGEEVVSFGGDDTRLCRLREPLTCVLRMSGLWKFYLNKDATNFLKKKRKGSRARPRSRAGDGGLRLPRGAGAPRAAGPLSPARSC